MLTDYYTLEFRQECDGSTVSGASAERVKGWSGIIWRLLHSHLWRVMLAMGWRILVSSTQASPCGLLHWASLGFSQHGGWIPQSKHPTKREPGRGFSWPSFGSHTAAQHLLYSTDWKSCKPSQLQEEEKWNLPLDSRVASSRRTCGTGNMVLAILGKYKLL